MQKQLYIKSDNEFVPVKEFTGFPTNGVWLVENGSQMQIHKLPHTLMPPFLPALYDKQDQAFEYVDQKIGDTYSRADILKYTIEFYSKLITQQDFPEAFL